ncbi:LpqB family beta-propeller domain-containing protein [Micropruina sp.]|uniref:LpqB family beta-propeller domain-containing protein n=1 Tax=Micropruina sp. TaxID=2737536 RepID=UPI0039E3C982
MRRLGGMAVCLAMVLAGCVAVPTSGPVERHSPAAEQANPGVEIAPVPPAADAPPGLIVEGFLHAMATYQDGYAVARQFLTSAASELWQPEAGVEIYAAGYPPQVSDSGVVLTAPLIGRLNAQGSFTTVSTSAPQYLHDFGLVRDADNQWRISQPPRGLLISQSLFVSTWVRADVCFWDATGTVLVPDPRFVPKGRIGLLDTVRAVLMGPSSLTAAAYRVPLVAQLQATAVSLSANGLAEVELGGATDELGQEAKRRLAAELVWSLTSLEGVTAIRIRGNGALWDVGDSAGLITTADNMTGAPVQPLVSDQVFVLRDGAIQRLGWDAPAGDAQPLGAGVVGNASTIAARSDGQVVAVVTDGGTRLRTVQVREGTARVELAAQGLALVRWTRQNELLVALERTHDTRLRMVRNATTVPVRTDALPTGRIRSLAVAPDGVRVALVIEEQGRSVLGTTAMVREGDEVWFTGWRELSGTWWAPSTHRPVDVGWSDAAELLVLLTVAGTPQVVRVDSEGAVATAVGPTDSSATAQLAVGGAGRAVLRGSDGQTWRFVDDFTWEPWLSKVQHVSMP